MIFLNPAFLFGLFAASIPLIIHLLNLRKLKKVEFSTLAFLKELQKTKIRRVKLKQWILLALRILIIVMLVAAFARPTLKNVSLGGTTSAAKISAVFILDNSFSMSVVDEDGSYFNHAKEIIKSILIDFQDGDEAAIILTSDGDDILPVVTSNRKQLINFLNDTEISYVSRKLFHSLSKANNILSKSKNFNKEIYLFTDFQKDHFLDHNSGRPSSQKIFDENIKLYTFNFSNREIDNIAAIDFKINNQIFEINKTISFTALVNNYSKESVSGNILSLFINGTRSAQQGVDLEAWSSKQITLETTLNETGILEVYVELEDDEILYDNKRIINLYVPERISVIIFSDRKTDTRFIEFALSGESNTKNFDLTHRELSSINSIVLNNYDVLVIVGSENISKYDKLADFLTKGGSLLLIPSSQSTLNKFNQLLSAISLPQSNKMMEFNTGVPAEFDFIDFNHPLFSDLFNSDSKKQIDSPKFVKYFRLTTEGLGKNIISLADNSSFLSEYGIGSGKVILFNSAPILKWSDLPLKGIFAPLINKCIYYLTSKIREEDNYIAGDEIMFNIKNNFFSQYRVINPKRLEEYINLDTLSLRNYLAYKNSDYVGTYKLFYGSNLIDYATVNTDPMESNTVYLTDKEIENNLDQLNFLGSHIVVSLNDDFSERISQARFGSELWRSFLLIACLLALVEMMIARSTKKDLVNI